MKINLVNGNMRQVTFKIEYHVNKRKIKQKNVNLNKISHLSQKGYYMINADYCTGRLRLIIYGNYEIAQ